MSKTIKFSILQIIVLLIFISSFLIIINFYFSYKESVTDFGKKIVKEATDKLTERIENFLINPVSYNNIAATLMEENKIEQNYEKLWSYLWEIILINNQIESIYIGDSSGNFIQVRKYPKQITRVINRITKTPVEKIVTRNKNYQIIMQEINIPPKDNYDPRTRPWYKNTQTEKRIYWTEPYVFSTTKNIGITASMPILDSKGVMKAVSGIDIPLEFLSDFMAEQKITENSKAFIVNEKNELIAYPDKNQVIKKNSKGELSLASLNDIEEKWFPEALLQSKHHHRFLTTVNGITYIVNILELPKKIGLKWRIIITTPYEDLYGSVTKSLIISIGIALIIMVLAFLVAYYFSNRITKPIGKLAEMTEEIKEFRLDNFKEVSSNIKEVNLLSKTLMASVNGLKAFKKYVPADLVLQLIKAGEEAKQGGRKKEISIFFSDIEGFTTISEQLSPEALMLHISDYLDALSKVIMQFQGTIDKYIGDSIMAFWGAPNEIKDPALFACQAALACQKKLEELNQKWKTEGKPVLKTRIGLNTGEVIVGNMGSNERLNYTIIGDNVNLASRLEGINKEYGTYLIAAENIYEKTKELFCFRFLDIVAVKGKKKGVKIYELLDYKENITKDKIDYVNDFEQGISHYLSKSWDKANEIFSQLKQQYPDDESVKLYIERINYLKNHINDLPADWNGVTVMKHK